MSFAVSDDPAATPYQVFHQTPSSTALSFWKDVNIRKSKVFKQVDQHIFVLDDDMSRNTFVLKSSDNIFEEVKVSRMTEMKQNFHEKIRLVWFADSRVRVRSEEHTSELQSRGQIVCRLLLVYKERCKHSR